MVRFVLLFGIYYIPKMNVNANILSDSLSNPDYIKSNIRYTKIYPFINYQMDFLEWNDTIVPNRFFCSLKNAKAKKMKILHIGDSHVQADAHTGFIRNRMQEIFGLGGRGFVFPYAAASTHAAVDYRTTCKGKWAFSKNVQTNPSLPLGISGVTVFTKDADASFSLLFTKHSIKQEFTKLKIYCKTDSASFDLKIKYSAGKEAVFIYCKRTNQEPYIEVDLPNVTDTFQFFITKNNATQSFFECYGISVETAMNTGILYSSVGINGAGLKSILKENLFPEQLASYNPDLVVIDVGANDFYMEGFKQDELKGNLEKIIDIIKKSSPEANILITNSQNIYKRRTEVTACLEFSNLTRQIAMENCCLFFDYFKVSGGSKSMLKWLQNKLARKDKVHLTALGYRIKGELLLNAILNSYHNFLVGNKGFVITNKEFSKDLNATSFTKDLNLDHEKKNNPKTKNATQNSTKKVLTYKVISGDNLCKISKKFKVSIAQIKEQNHLSDDKINVGMILTIKQ
jgi:lysophospholipase L1-like esterase